MTSVTPYCYNGKVIRWIDGDTVDIEVDLGFKVKTIQRFRLLGVQTPERGEVDFKEAKELSSSICPPGSCLIFSSTKSEKYGRWLVDIEVVREALLTSGLATPNAGFLAMVSHN